MDKFSANEKKIDNLIQDSREQGQRLLSGAIDEAKEIGQDVLNDKNVQQNLQAGLFTAAAQLNKQD